MRQKTMKASAKSADLKELFASLADEGPAPRKRRKPVQQEACQQVNHREALARILRFATGVEPSPDVLQQMLARGARAFWEAP